MTPKIVLTAGPLFLLASLAISIIMTNSPKNLEAFPMDDDRGHKKELDWEKYSKKAPDNVTEVRAFADSSKAEPIVSSQTYSFENPYFEWDPAKVNDNENRVKGYNVYFVDSVPEDTDLIEYLRSKRPVYVDDTNFQPADYDIELVKGRTYTLFIQTVSVGSARFSYDRNLNIPSKRYFTYKYQ